VGSSLVAAPAAAAAPNAAPGEESDGELPPVAARVGGDWFSSRFDELARELEARVSSPRAAATLYRLGELAGRLDTLAPLAQLLAKTAEDSRATGEVRSLARWLEAGVALSRGRLPRARAQLEKLGFATEGWLVGAFDNEGGAGHATAFAPETGPLDLRASYLGKEREVQWRKLPPLGPSGRVPVQELVRPRKNGTFYVLMSLESPSAQRGVLSLGTSGATKLWVNGQLAVDDPTDHPARFDQRAVGVPLRKGANTVLLKVSVLDEVPGFFLRASAPGGRPLAGAKFVAPAPEAALAAVSLPSGREPAPADRPAPVEDLAAALGRLASLSPSDGALREDYALLLSERRPFDSKLQLHRREQQRATELLPREPAAFLRLASFIEDDHNERRAALEQALAIDPGYAPARTALGRYYLERGYSRRAFDELSRAAGASPDYWPARLGLAEALGAMGLEGRARRTLLETAASFPTSPEVVAEAARTERALGRRLRAIERYRVLLALRHDRPGARSELAELLADAGELDAALGALQRDLELSPASVGTTLRLARLLSANGRPAEALAAYDRAAEFSPDDDAVFEARGRHLLRVGDEGRAMDDFQRALAIKPQNAQLRETLRSLRPQENFAAPFLRDGAKLAAEARASPVPAGEDALTLADVNVVRVYENGLSSRTHQQVTRVLTARGVEQNRTSAIPYSPGEHEVRVERARLFKPDGSVVEAKSESDRSIGESGGMFFDRRQRLVTFGSLDPGDVLELTWRLDDVSSTNMFADYFGDVEFLQGTDPVRDVEYVLVAPAARNFYANKPKLASIEHRVELDGDRRVWRWRARDVPKLEPEPRMPGWADVAAYLHVSTFREWNEVARFWWGLVKDQLHVTPEVAAAAEEAVRGLDPQDTRARVRAVYGYVVRKTRYIGLEFGIHGFKPYKVDRVLARRFGDCKDKASLIKAMLGHLGIDSRLVLLRMRNLGQLQAEPASLAVFNHAIAYVPSLDLYLDGTAEFSGSGELPGADQGAQVLVVEDDARVPSRFLVTPVTRPDDNVTGGEYEIALNADGSARLTGATTIRGLSAQSYRRAYESETGRRERFEQGWARSYPGARATAFDLGDPRAIEDPVRTSFALEVPQLGRTDRDALGFSPFGEAFRYVESYAPLSRRAFPQDLGAPWRNEFRYGVKLPAGHALVDAPAPLEKSGPFGSYRYSVESRGDSLLVTGHVTLAVDRVQPAEYPAFRAFLEDVDRAFSRRLRVAPAAAAARAEAAR
jgi:tetratricopeptide (TPR) repeat protein/transglutaminase-like putative cysteine protease